ncbi:hypothetical protein SFRURICE_012164 [Spodoptera frugiperda]|nr:hypothetical protein SFRURICE_012164 [Spodoptera frugiperda]
MLEFKFTQHIKEPTRITHTTSTCLDLIFTNFNDNSLHTTVEELGFSDHCGTIVNMTFKQETKELVWFTVKRLFNTNNIQKFKSKLSTQNWNNIITPNKNLNENYQHLNECIPTRRIKLKTKQSNFWLTTGIKTSCRNKRLLKILSIKINNPIITKYYKKYEKILKKSVITAKKLHYINKMNKSTNKVKTMWNIVKERTNKISKKDKQNITLQTTSLISDPTQIANIFNDFFASIGENISPKSGFDRTNTAVINPTQNTMFLSPVDGYEVNSILKNLKNKNTVYKYIQEALNVINNKHYAVGILLDMTKAYDRVQFDILLHKLHGIGVRGKAHDWFVSYLKSREQLVEVELETVNEFTLLGLTIDTNINWKSHILKLKSKISKFSYALYEIKKTTDLKTALTMYYAYAHAWFTYGIILWGNSTDAQKLIRIITNIEQTDSCKPHFTRHKILTLVNIYILELCKLVRKYPDFYKKRRHALKSLASTQK